MTDASLHVNDCCRIV